MNIFDKKQMAGTIALLTDFGLTDHYVGLMKGVITKINPNCNIIDLTNDIQSQNIKQGAFILMNSFKYFPQKTIFVVVIDPGVGSSRKAICVKTKDYYFIAPNNGVLSYTLNLEKPVQVVEITNKAVQLEEISNTFHGRDIFAPAAAHLCNDYRIEKLGSNLQLEELVKSVPLYLKITRKQIVGEVIYYDRFGNLITSIPGIKLHPNKINNIQVGNHLISKLSLTYADANIGELLAYIGSSGYLEIAIRNGSAKDMLTNIDKIYVNY